MDEEEAGNYFIKFPPFIVIVSFFLYTTVTETSKYRL